MTCVRVGLFGATGRMGRAITAVLAEEPSTTLVAAWAAEGDPSIGRDAGELAGLGAIGARVTSLEADAAIDADVVIDFSRPEGTTFLAARCDACRVPLVSGTTGLDAAAQAELDALAEHVPIVVAPNMSVGVTLLFHLAELATRLAGSGFDAEIVEMHHRLKVDAPSGTAIRLAERVARARAEVAEDVVLHGRSGAVGPRTDREIGVMTLRGGDVVGDHTLVLAGIGERLELTHRAHDRSIFARGAVRAARWVIGKHPGRYDMPDVLGIRAVG